MNFTAINFDSLTLNVKTGDLFIFGSIDGIPMRLQVTADTLKQANYQDIRRMIDKYINGVEPLLN